MDLTKDTFGGYLNHNKVIFIDEEEWVIASFDSRLEVFFAKNQKHYHTFNEHKKQIINFTYFPKINYESGATEQILASVDIEGQLICWRLSDLTVESTNNIGDSISFAEFISNNERDNKMVFLSDIDRGHYHLVDLESLKVTKLTRRIKGKFKAGRNIIKIAKLDNDQEYVIEAKGRNVAITDLKNGNPIRSFEHFAEVSAIAFDRVRKVFCLGDINGKLTYYYGCLTIEEKGEAVKPSSTVHWHSQKVSSLCFNVSCSLLLSGGEEGVLVLWHQYENKKDFLPRLGGEIKRISTNEDDSLIIISLNDNSIKIIRSANFSLHSQISSLTNPLIYSPSVEPDTPFFLTGIIQHPSNGLLVTNSAPGKIQFYDYFQKSKVKDFAIISRNITSRVREAQPEAQEVNFINFDSTGKYMAASVQRRSCHGLTSFSTLMFFDETSLLTFGLNTRVEYPHGTSVQGLISFVKKGEDEGLRYVSFGSDKKFKIWRKFERKVRDTVHSEEINPLKNALVNYFWNCEFEGEYKKLSIQAVAHVYSEKQSADLLLAATENLIVCWNLDKLTLEYAYEVFDSQINSICVLETEDTILLAVWNRNNLALWDINGKKTVWSLELGQIKDVVFKTDSKSLVLLFEKEAGQNKIDCLLNINPDTGKLEKLAILPYKIRSLHYLTFEDRYIILGFDQSFSAVILDKVLLNKERFEDVFENQGVAVQREKNLLSSATRAESEFDFAYDKFMKSSKLHFHDDGSLRILNESSHMIPPANLLYKEFMNNFLVASEENSNQRVTGGKGHSMDVESGERFIHISQPKGGINKKREKEDKLREIKKKILKEVGDIYVD